MSNEYKSYYLADLKALIRATALDTMAAPMIYFEEDKPMEANIRRNANVAIYNDGIKTFADALIDALSNEVEKE